MHRNVVFHGRSQPKHLITSVGVLSCIYRGSCQHGERALREPIPAHTNRLMTPEACNVLPQSAKPMPPSAPLLRTWQRSNALSPGWATASPSNPPALTASTPPETTAQPPVVRHFQDTSDPMQRRASRNVGQQSLGAAHVAHAPWPATTLPLGNTPPYIAFQAGVQARRPLPWGRQDILWARGRKVPCGNRSSR